VLETAPPCTLPSPSLLGPTAAPSPRLETQRPELRLLDPLLTSTESTQFLRKLSQL
jgi:hypothetical protein